MHPNLLGLFTQISNVEMGDAQSSLCKQCIGLADYFNWKLDNVGYDVVVDH